MAGLTLPTCFTAAVPTSYELKQAVRVPPKAARMSQGSVLVPLRLERAEEEAALLEYSMRTSRGAVYLHCTGGVRGGVGAG